MYRVRSFRARSFGGRTYDFSETLGQIGDVQVGRHVVTFGLETGVEGFLSPMLIDVQVRDHKHTHPGKTDFVSELVEATDTHLGVASVAELGKTKPRSASAHSLIHRADVQAHPLQALVEVSMMALEVSTSPKREAYLKSSSSSVVG